MKQSRYISTLLYLVEMESMKQSGVWNSLGCSPIHNQLNEVEIKFGPNHLHPHQNDWEPRYSGGLNAMTRAQCYCQCLWIVKKYAVTNTETDLGKDVFIFTIGFNTTDQTSTQWDNPKVGKHQCMNNRNDTVECHDNTVQFVTILHTALQWQ